MPLSRHYQNVKALAWLNDNHFVGTVERRLVDAVWDGKRQKYVATRNEEWKSVGACYGWSKGAGFFVYTIGDGHIEKIGSIKREEIQ